MKSCEIVVHYLNYQVQLGNEIKINQLNKVEHHVKYSVWGISGG